MKKDVGNGVRAEVVRLPGRRQHDFAAKVYVGSRHIATVSEPCRCTAAEALDVARNWARKYKKALARNAS